VLAMAVEASVTMRPCEARRPAATPCTRTCRWRGSTRPGAAG
jgi:hypothetical protein